MWGFVAGMLSGDVIRVLWAEIRDEEPLDTLRGSLESAAASGSSIGGWLSEYHGWRSGRLTGRFDGNVKSVRSKSGGAIVFSLLSSRRVWIEANFRETGLTHMRPGEVSVGWTYPRRES
jgi:hypothetical protein